MMAVDKNLVSSSPGNDCSDYFDQHPIRIVSSLNPLGLEIWNLEMCGGTKGKNSEKSSQDKIECDTTKG
jgi:hypothetical protein